MLKWIALGLGVWLLWPRGARAGEPEIDDPDPDDPDPDEPEAPTIRQILDPLISDTPRVGAGYQMSGGKILYGNNGVIAQALRAAGIPSGGTGAQRVDYYKAITRVRSNWRLYGTIARQATPAVERADVRSGAGDVATGTITAAMCRMHDGWRQAASQGSLPARLIGWNRSSASGKCASVTSAVGWRDLIHSSQRRFGLLWLPPLESMDLGLDVTDRPDMDWPTALYDAAGTTWAEAFA